MFQRDEVTSDSLRLLKQETANSKIEDITFQNFKTNLAEKISHNLSCRESLNSSGTVSRKTSTASDYTPENTFFMDTRVPFTDQTNVSYVTESCMSVAETYQKNNLPIILSNESVVQDEVKSGQKVDLKIVMLRKDSDPNYGQLKVDVSDSTSVEAEEGAEKKAKVPQRKISRFLVSPVFSGQLDLPKGKNYGETLIDGIDNQKGTGVTSPPANLQQNVFPEQTFQSYSQSSGGNLLNMQYVPQFNVQNNQIPIPQRKDSAALDLKTDMADKLNEIPYESSGQKTTPAFETEAPICGPEMITLEQLKISLEHLKQGGPVTLKESLEAEIKSSQPGKISQPKQTGNSTVQGAAGSVVKVQNQQVSSQVAGQVSNQITGAISSQVSNQTSGQLVGQVPSQISSQISSGQNTSQQISNQGQQGVNQQLQNQQVPNQQIQNQIQVSTQVQNQNQQLTSEQQIQNQSVQNKIQNQSVQNQILNQSAQNQLVQNQSAQNQSVQNSNLQNQQILSQTIQNQQQIQSQPVQNQQIPTLQHLSNQQQLQNKLPNQQLLNSSSAYQQMIQSTNSPPSVQHQQPIFLNMPVTSVVTSIQCPSSVASSIQCPSSVASSMQGASSTVPSMEGSTSVQGTVVPSLQGPSSIQGTIASSVQGSLASSIQNTSSIQVTATHSSVVSSKTPLSVNLDAVTAHITSGGSTVQQVSSPPYSGQGVTSPTGLYQQGGGIVSPSRPVYISEQQLKSEVEGGLDGQKKIIPPNLKLIIER